MLSKKIAKALNGQINAEIYSSYMYLSMSAWFEQAGLAGFANWMLQQAREEMSHAMKFFHFVSERGGRVLLEKIAQPPTDWKSALDVFEATLAHERKVTGLINDLTNLALDERDHATNIFLQWFISEQVEEEAGVGAVLDKLKLIGKDTSGLFALDQELGRRLFTPPPAG
ncbi:MAG: ferritin [Desulfurivibrionaceae bacterium]|nr:ferritin [Desulfobulbales bacterium]MDT8334170.1 ferritin [Desulfurivibrionaceae bacterium]